jgi:hypothetical protein
MQTLRNVNKFLLAIAERVKHANCRGRFRTAIWLDKRIDQLATTDEQDDWSLLHPKCLHRIDRCSSPSGRYCRRQADCAE